MLKRKMEGEKQALTTKKQQQHLKQIKIRIKNLGRSRASVHFCEVIA